MSIDTQNKSMSLYETAITFKVSDVEKANYPLSEEPYENVIVHKFFSKKNRRKTLRIESFSRNRPPLIKSRNNAFFETVYYAYADHRPLIISPDMIWLLIIQGFAIHLNQNAEALRDGFVTFKGKKQLNIQINDNSFELGNENNDWGSIFSSFKGQIAAYTGKELIELVAARFSGTPIEAQVAFDITLMDSMKSYFEYSMTTICGIPEITLEGTIQDWVDIEERAAQLANYDLKWWIEDIKLILSEFTKTAKGEVNQTFWASIVQNNRHDAPCAPRSYLTGWICKLYPYLERKSGGYYKNGLIGAGDLEQYYHGNDIKYRHYTGPIVEGSDFPEGLSNADLLFIDYQGVQHHLELNAGFFGIHQDLKTLALRPMIGWAVIETVEEVDFR